MKNLNKLGFILSVGTLSALSFSLGACSDDETTGTAGTAGTTAGNSTTAGTGGSSAGTGGSTAGTGGSTAGKGGTGGSGGSGGSAAGSGGTAGKGGTGGSGGAAGSGGGGGAGGGGGGPSAACTKWCSGDSGLAKKCMGSNLLNPVVNTEQKCLDYCAKPAAAAGLSCWQMHLDLIKQAADQDPHCGHASGFGDKKGMCAEITQ